MMTLGLLEKTPSCPDAPGIRILGACLLLVAALLAACSIKVRTGYDPNITALETKLVPAVSTRQQVSGALGWPYGEGRALMPFHDKPRDVVTYYYEEGTLDDDRRIFLFVFLNEDAYEGYMWFSSLEKK